MTPAQERTIERIRQYIEEHDLHSEKYEIKEFKIENCGTHKISVITVSGLKHDEGTLAACLCRKTRHIFIGKRGGITAYGKDARPYKGWINGMVHGYRT